MRGKQAKRRIIKPDIKYSSVTVQKLINYIMNSGKKSTAQRIVYGALDIAAKKSKQKHLDVLKKAIDNVGPTLEVKSRRIGGANYQIPFEVNSERKLVLSLRWIVDAARSQKGKSMEELLAREILNAYKGEGTAIKKKDDTQRMAEANRAFAHFARY